MSESSGNTSPTAPAGVPKRTAPGTAGARKSASKSGRSRAREFVLQALYQHLVGRNSADAIDAFTRDLSGFHKADAAHYNTVLHGCIETAEYMDALITPLLDRKLAEISPIEHAAMWIGVFEFQHCPDVPWRVVLNECIELAKEFGGTDGHKYVNAVLGGLAPQLRPLEVAADQGRSAHKNAAFTQPTLATPAAESDAAAPAAQPAPDDSTPPPAAAL